MPHFEEPNFSILNAADAFYELDDLLLQLELASGFVFHSNITCTKLYGLNHTRPRFKRKFPSDNPHTLKLAKSQPLHGMDKG